MKVTIIMNSNNQTNNTNGFIEVKNKKQTRRDKIREDTSTCDSQVSETHVSGSQSSQSRYKAVKKTKMCNSVNSGEQCKWGSRCSYAHSSQELCPIACNFGARCCNIIPPASRNDIYINNPRSTRMCNFIHPDEAISNYEERLSNIKRDGYVTPCQSPRRSVTTPPPAPMRPKLKTSLKSHMRDASTSGIELQVDIPRLLLLDDEQDDGKIVIHVPENMAIEMLRTALKNGKTNIEIRTH